MNIKTLLVDDEDLARRGLKIRLKDAPDIEIIGEAAHGEEALRMVDELKPDLMFLDIQMPGMNGFDVLKALADKRIPMIVFVTAYDEYAVRAFDAHAIDYLLKPIDENRLEEALSHIREQWEQRDRRDRQWPWPRAAPIPGRVLTMRCAPASRCSAPPISASPPPCPGRPRP